MRDEALRLLEAGLAVVPINPATKRTPTAEDHGGGYRWSEFQHRLPTEAEVAAFVRRYPDCWLGVVCGEGSGQLEAIDFDIPNKDAFKPGETGEAPSWRPWCRLLIDNGHEDLLRSLVVVETQSGGRHVYYRCPEAGRNHKLAETDWQHPDTGASERKTLIETRGNGGLVVVPPSPGYKLLNGSMAAIPTISQEDRNLLIEAARLLDETPLTADPNETAAMANGAARPGDDFNARVSWDEILSSHGWTRVRSLGKQTFWRRPGKSSEWSARTGGDTGDAFYCWSTNAGVPAGKTLSKFAFVAHVEHGGDYSKCAAALRARGYGASSPQAVHPSRAEQPAPNDSTDMGLPAIVCNNRPMRDVTADAMDALRAHNDPPTLFVRAGLLSKVVYDERGQAKLETLNEAQLRATLDRSADWQRATKDGPRPVPPPKEIVQDVQALGYWPGIPPIVNVTRAPVLGPGGSIRTEHGYCGDARAYVAWNDECQPWQGNAVDAARYLITELFSDFCFASDADRAHALALLLLPFIRPIIDGPTPLHLVDAPVQGTGKSLLVRVCLSPSQGPNVGATSGTRDEEEWRKKIASALIEGRPYVLLDNLTRKLDSDALAGAIASTEWYDRVLGVMANVSLPVRCAWAATSNNAELSRDLVRRTVWIRLDAGVERPEDRTGWRHGDILNWIGDNRGSIVSAVVAILQSWVAAGKPVWSGRVLGTFEAWCRAVGGILEHAGIPGFLGNVEELRATADREEEVWWAFVSKWWDTHKTARVSSSDLWDVAKDDESMVSLCDGKTDQAVKVRFGTALRRRSGRIYGGRKIMVDGGRGHKMLYRLVSLNGENDETHHETHHVPESLFEPTDNQKSESSESSESFPFPTRRELDESSIQGEAHAYISHGATVEKTHQTHQSDNEHVEDPYAEP